MSKDRELWNFVAERLGSGENVMLLVVAESTGSSPGRAGYKMAVATDGGLVGSIGGGVMEVALVERSKAILLSKNPPSGEISKQTHRRNADSPSGMICSGEQTVILKLLTAGDLENVLRSRHPGAEMSITQDSFVISPAAESAAGSQVWFVSNAPDEFRYREHLTFANDLYIVGGGHCALALSSLMSNMSFRIHIFDDRPELNTIQKNEFADEISIVESYESIGGAIPVDPDAYVAVMTLGYKTDALVIRQLAAREFKYFGVLGSRAKMAALLKQLRDEGVDPERLKLIRTPIGIPINSRTPEEIAVSIAAEMIAVKNA